MINHHNLEITQKFTISKYSLGHKHGLHLTLTFLQFLFQNDINNISKYNQPVLSKDDPKIHRSKIFNKSCITENLPV